MVPISGVRQLQDVITSCNYATTPKLRNFSKDSSESNQIQRADGLGDTLGATSHMGRDPWGSRLLASSVRLPPLDLATSSFYLFAALGVPVSRPGSAEASMSLSGVSRG